MTADDVKTATKPAPPAVRLLLHLISPHGRISRSQWWQSWFLEAVLAFFILTFVTPSGSGFGMVDTMFWVLFLWIGFCTNAKRLHDRNMAAPWVLFTFVPVVGYVWAFTQLGMREGMKGPNAYGPEPGNHAIWDEGFGKEQEAPSLAKTKETISEILRPLNRERAKILASLQKPLPAPAKTHAPPNIAKRPATLPVVATSSMIKYGYKRPDKTISRGGWW